MYLEQGALSINPLLSSRAIMTLLARKYKDASEMLCQAYKNKDSKLSIDEILMLIRTPSFRVLLEKSYCKLIGKPIPDDIFFERLMNIGIDRESLLSFPYDSKYNLIAPAPFLTSVISPLLNNCQDGSTILCDIYRTFPLFSGTSSRWFIAKPTDLDMVSIISALRELGRISLEPIEDIAFNIRFITIVESSIQEAEVSRGASFSFQYLPGVIFLGGSVLKEPAYLVESLYHESLHTKLINTYHAYDLLQIEVLRDIEKFICPWAIIDEEAEWPFRRAAAAYHVYCHLLAFHRLVVHQRGTHMEWSKERISTIRTKLFILEEYIQQSKKSGVFTDLGISYFTSLGQIGEI